jgi:hypothetical protein
MTADALNPLEALTERLATEYVLDVKRLTQMFAPIRPWWSATLSPDAQLWRWETGPRTEIVGWLMQAGVYMGAKDETAALAKIEDIFTSPAAGDLIPPQVVAQIPPELLEMVQAAGPKDAGTHIRKMEAMHAGRMQAVELFKSPDVPNVPEPPIQPPPLPVELMPKTAGKPLYGMAPQEPGSKTATQPSSVDLAGH